MEALGLSEWVSLVTLVVGLPAVYLGLSKSIRDAITAIHEQHVNALEAQIELLELASDPDFTNKVRRRIEAKEKLIAELQLEVEQGKSEAAQKVKELQGGIAALEDALAKSEQARKEAEEKLEQALAEAGLSGEAAESIRTAFSDREAAALSTQSLLVDALTLDEVPIEAILERWNDPGP